MSEASHTNPPEHEDDAARGASTPPAPIDVAGSEGPPPEQPDAAHVGRADEGPRFEFVPTVNTPVVAKPRRPAKGTSRLGLLAILFGTAACVLCRSSILPPNLRFSPTPLAAAGVALACLAMVGIIVGSRARAGLPILAILVCLTALGISAYQGNVRDIGSARNWAAGQVQEYKTVLTQLKNKVAPPSPPSNGAAPVAHPSIPAQAPAGVSAPGRPAEPDVGIGAGSIFDMRPGAPGSSPPAAGAPARPAAPPPAGSPGLLSIPSPAAPGAGVPLPGLSPGGLPMTSAVLSARAAVVAAEAKVRAAEDAFVLLTPGPAIRGTRRAEAEVNAANQLVEDAKRRSDAFGQPVIDAARQRKEAQEKVARIVNEAMDRDAAVAASRRELSAAEDSLRQAYDAARSAK